MNSQELYQPRRAHVPPSNGITSAVPSFNYGDLAEIRIVVGKSWRSYRSVIPFPIKYRPLASPSSLLVRLLAQDEIVDSQDDRGGRETQCRQGDTSCTHVADVTLARAAIARPSPLAVRYRDSNKRTCAQGSADLIRATPRHGSKIPLKGLALATSRMSLFVWGVIIGVKKGVIMGATRGFGFVGGLWCQKGDTMLTGVLSTVLCRGFWEHGSLDNRFTIWANTIGCVTPRRRNRESSPNQFRKPILWGSHHW